MQLQEAIIAQSKAAVLEALQVSRGRFQVLRDDHHSGDEVHGIAVREAEKFTLSVPTGTAEEDDASPRQQPQLWKRAPFHLIGCELRRCRFIMGLDESAFEFEPESLEEDGVMYFAGIVMTKGETPRDGYCEGGRMTGAALCTGGLKKGELGHIPFKRYSLLKCTLVCCEIPLGWLRYGWFKDCDLYDCKFVS